MNILFYHRNGIYPTSGGISKITCNLTSIFRAKSHNVYYLAIRPIKNKDYKYDKNQYFLPTETIDKPENISFIEDLIDNKKIQFVINQCPFDTDFLNCISKLKSKHNFKIISCYHNSIITPVKNYAFQKEWYWKNAHKSWVFMLMKQSLVKKLAVNLYIFRNRCKFRQTFEKSDAVVVLCDGLKRELLSMIGINDSSKINVIPNFNTTHLLYNQKKENTVLWVGTTEFQTKRLDFMLEIWSAVYSNNPDWKLVVLGDGANLADAKSYVEKSGIKNVSFEGRVTPKNYLESAKIICITSSHEAFSLVTIEGLAAGVYPVVNNSFPAASMLIKNKENGSLVKSFSRSDFVRELDRVMNSPLPSPESLAASVEKYNPEQAYQNWMTLFESLKWNDSEQI